jgi:lipopolysaccharide biosynthesis regulator YciM
MTNKSFSRDVLDKMLDAETERHIAEQEAALSQNPEWAEGHLHLGLLYRVYQGRQERAKRELLRALELKPSLAEAHIALGEIYISEGDFNRARLHADYASQFGNTRLRDQIDRYSK